MSGGGETKRAYRITQWELYEPDPKSGGTVGPLNYVRWRVHGLYPSPTYRRLQALAMADTIAAYALFGKLVEMAADQPRSLRDGVIRAKREGLPATVADIAFHWLGLDSRAACEQVERSLGHLMDPAVGWIEAVEHQELDAQRKSPASPGISGESPETPGECGNSREMPGDSPAIPGKPRLDLDGDGDGDLDKNSSPLLPPTPPSPLNSFSEPGGRDSDSVSCGEAKGHAGIRASTCAKLMGMLRVPARSERKRLSAAARRQAAADETTLIKICGFVVQARNPGLARFEAESLLKLARSPSIANRERPMRAFVPEYKKRWPGLFDKTSGLPEIRAGPLKQAAAL